MPPRRLAAQSRPTANASPAESPPSIVVLFADDAGYADFGFQARPHPHLAARTPNIDRIAREGARFTSAYMSGAVCSPSRAGLMTGRYQQRFGHENNLPVGFDGGLPLSETTIGDAMARTGATTGIVGKWHLGYPAAYHPNRRGFDWFHGLLQGSRPYGPMPKPSPLRVIQENGEALPEEGHVTTRFGEAAARWIRQRAREAESFFLFVSFTAPHGPLQPDPQDMEELGTIEGKRRAKYAGLVVGLDRAVGRILETLDQTGLADRTVVVFTNDNGGQTRTGAINSPLRGGKGQLFEGGIRVPMTMRWPGHIAPGSTIDDPVISLDLLPTLVATRGSEIDAAPRLDGVNLLPRLTGERDRLAPRDLFWRTGGATGSRAIRRGPHKLVVLPSTPDRDRDEQKLLFDLDKDIGETTDLASDQPERVAELYEALMQWDATLVAPLWTTGRKR